MPDLESVLPLSRSQLYLLLAIQEGEWHGYAVKKRVEELSGGVVRMGPGTLYAAIQRAEERGLIRESDERPPEGQGISRPPVDVRVGPDRPQGAFVSVRKDGWWYYIDQADLPSKQMFSLVSILLQLSEAGERASAPLLTIGTGG